MFPAIKLAPEQGMACIHQRKPKRLPRAKRELGDREQAWHDLKPQSLAKKPITRTGFLAPYRVGDEDELPLITEELHANGFSAISLSSSSGDDDEDELEAANYAERNLNLVPYGYGQKGVDAIWGKNPDGKRQKYAGPVLLEQVDTEIKKASDEGWTDLSIGFPTYYDAEEIVHILRRIDWEKENAACGPTITVKLIAGPNGISATTEQPWMDKLISLDELAILGKKVKRACGSVTIEELDNNRARVAFYGARGSILYGVTSGEFIPEQSMDELGVEDLMAPEDEFFGEPELGLHGEGEPTPRRFGDAPFETVINPAEPSEFDLWPLEELAS